MSLWGRMRAGQVLGRGARRLRETPAAIARRGQHAVTSLAGRVPWEYAARRAAPERDTGHLPVCDDAAVADKPSHRRHRAYGAHVHNREA